MSNHDNAGMRRGRLGVALQDLGRSWTGPLAPYEGQLATRSFIPTLADSVNKQANSRTHHRSRTNITDIAVDLPTWYWNRLSGLAESVVSGITYEASVEYPKNVFTRLLWSGGNTGSGRSDTLFMKIPRNKKFWIRTYAVGSTSLIASDTTAASRLLVQDQNPDCDSYEYGTSVTNKVMGGTLVNTDNTLNSKQFFPVAIFGTTTWPTALLVGNSRQRGFGDTFDANGDIGEMARSIGPKYAYINVGSSGDSLSQYIASNTNRTALKRYCTTVFLEHAINALRSGTGQNKTAAAVLVEQQTMLALFAGKRRIVSTTGPQATSTDTWATDTNQTVNSNAAQIRLYNDAIRAGVANADGYVEIADVYETARNTTKWKFDGNAGTYTLDGLHGTRAMYDLIYQTHRFTMPNLVR